ncbi:MAG TPA: heavy metal translocating P-type ATPase, partial [Tepidisphaeraceae bacterium]|nr:heavy metal translocating P-type ATPase [Tepidisphaeraceae bacterium]
GAPAESKLNAMIAVLAIVAIGVHLVLRFAVGAPPLVYNFPLFIALGLGGTPLVYALLRQLLRARFGSDLLAGISIVTAVLLHEYLAGTLVVLMLSGGEALEAYAVRSASSVLRALAKRMPSVAHAKRDGEIVEIQVESIMPGELLLVRPHEICPADGTVVEGHGSMDESYLTGEPYHIAKAPGTEVLSGAVNGASALIVQATRTPRDSRYAKIMQVMHESEQERPRLRRLGDTLGALYTPLAVAIALVAGIVAHDPVRFLAVLVVATPCPLLIAIPVAIIGSISLAAKRGIIVKDPAVLEQLSTCRTIFFDKTGTLTYGTPRLTEIIVASGFDEADVLSLAASLEVYSKHPLANAVLSAAEARSIPKRDVIDVHEPPGQGLTGTIDGRKVNITGRNKVRPDVAGQLPPIAPGLECIVLINDQYAATLRFRDEPREDVRSFIRHLEPHHNIGRLILLTGDRKAEAEHLAKRVGIDTVYAEKSPEEKLAIVKAETAKNRTAYLGDGINDAPSLLAATVGIAFGKTSDVTAEAASAVILDSSLRKVDEFIHISKRLRTIALQSAVGGMALSLIAIGFAAAGHLPPVFGALTQEAIDIFAVLNALRAAVRPKAISDM